MNEEVKAKPRAKRVAIYLRVSTEDQLDGYGADTQESAVMNLIKARQNVPEPFVFAGKKYVYFDRGVSGTVPMEERPEFARLKEDILFSSEQNRPFDVVAVYRMDRFARRLKVLLDVIDFFGENDVEFLSVTENIDTSSPFGKAILSIIGVIAELEIETIKQRTQAGRIEAIKGGTYMGNAPPYGYTKNKDKKLRILEKEAEYVQLIFDLFVDKKYSIGEIAAYLKEHNVFSPMVSAIKNNKRKGKIKKQNSLFHWSHESVRTILRNELYIGKYYYKKSEDKNPLPREKWKVSPYTYPMIIDIVTFEKAQDIIDKSKHTGKTPKKRMHPYLLTGLLKCDYCKDERKEIGTYQHWTGTSKKIKTSGKYSHYYVCGRKNGKKYEKRCSVLPLPAREIEQYIANYCLKLLRSPVAVIKHQQKLKSEKVSMKHIQKKIDDINGCIRSIPDRKNRILEQHEHGFISTAQMEQSIDDLKKSEKRYAVELQKVQKLMAQNALSEHYISSLELFEKHYSKALEDIKKNPDEVYNILHMLIEEIVVYARPVTNVDVIAGRRSKDQQLPNRLHIKLKLPQEILNEMAERENPVIEKTSLVGDASSPSSSQEQVTGARQGIRTPDPLGVNEVL